MIKQTKEQEQILERAKKRFKQVVDVEADQRRREQEDLSFQVPENQWDAEARKQRQGQGDGGVPVPPRPILSVPKLDQPIQLVLNQERNAHLGVNIHPLSPEADEEVADVLQGLYRQIERDSQASVCRSWAFERAVKAGRGRYRVNTKYAEDTGSDPFDQEITIERILYQDCVYWDPAAQRPDYSDAQWCMVTAFVPVETYREMYRESDAAPMSEGDFADQIMSAPEWTQGDSETGAVQIAEYFWFETSKEKLILYSDGQVVKEGDEPPEGVEPTERVREREVKKLRWAKLSASEVLEGPIDWPGKYIPIVEVPGRELVPFDDKRIWYGMVRPARDGQKGYNFSISGAVEMAALEPKAPWIAAEGQIAENREMWETSNIRNYAVLTYKPVALGDTPVQPPGRVPVDMSRLGPSMALVQQFDTDIQAATATFDPALGNLSQRDRSGKAILALQNQADAGNSHYVQSLVNIAMAYEAKVILDLIPKIYDRPGRTARLLDSEEKTSTVMLNQPFVVNPETKRPEPAEEGKPPMWMKVGQKPPKIKSIDLSRGIYGVHVSIGRAYQTRLQQGADEIGKLLEAVPNLWPIIGPIYLKYRDFPGAEEMAKLLTRARDKQMPGLTADEDEPPSAEESQAALQQAQEQMKQMQQALQQAQQQLQGKVVEQKAMLAKAEMDNATKKEIAALKAQTEVTLADMKGKLDAIQASLDRAQEVEKDKFSAAHEMGKQAIAMAAKPFPEPQPGEPLEPDETV